MESVNHQILYMLLKFYVPSNLYWCSCPVQCYTVLSISDVQWFNLTECFSVHFRCFPVDRRFFNGQGHWVSVADPGSRGLAKGGCVWPMGWGESLKCCVWCWICHHWYCVNIQTVILLDQIECSCRHNWSKIMCASILFTCIGSGDNWSLEMLFRCHQMYMHFVFMWIYIFSLQESATLEPKCTVKVDEYGFFINWQSTDRVSIIYA